VLGGGEIIAALLFLLSATSIAGGYLLLVVFFFAAAIHVLHGQYDVGGLLVYAVAVMACVAQRRLRPELASDRAGGGGC
jgi:membrane protein implicated in regulation of membrane protease activity